MASQRTDRMIRGKRIIKGKWRKKEVDYVENEIILILKRSVFKELTTVEKRENMKESFLKLLPKGSNIVRDLNQQGRIIIELPKQYDVIEAIKKLSKNISVRYAEPNIVHETCQVIPNEYPNLNSLQLAQWGLDRIRVPWAWNQTTGDTRVLIAVIDSGIAGPERLQNAIYRWWNSRIGDHFYCQDPMGELAHGSGYSYEGSPFRLFSAGEPNTTPFYRWWKSSIGDHFYTTDPNGELAPQSGYFYEGSIGNIATIQLPNTVALYRWWKSSIGDHFYTTDPNGELAPQSGYQNEGIAGYVLPSAMSLLSHPDLSNQNRFIMGYDFVHNDNFPVDDLGHGTHVTGIASADTDNNQGIAGVSWNSRIFVIKIFEPFQRPNGTWTGQATSSDLADAIEYAVNYSNQHGLKVVINYSGRATQKSSVVESAVKYAKNNNCLIVAATGNDSDHANNNRASVGWPAAYSKKYENVIAVGAINAGNNLANFSNVGSEVCVVAPGVNIRSTLPNYNSLQNPTAQQYINWPGTSMATPHVSGLAALIWSIDNTLSPQRIREIIETTADNLGPQGKDNDFGYGRINCERALQVLTEGTIFRWWKSSIGDHFYTAAASGELAPQSGYLYEGAPFRLFPPNTQNTVPFHRWWKSSIGDHFYTTDPNGELAPQSGYFYEGSIGNIATIQLPNTVALYRWWKSSIGDHFYTTDPNGELAPQSGYQNEGIAGYVMLT